MPEIEETKSQESLSDVQVNLDEKHNPVVAEKPKVEEPKYVTIDQIEKINRAINYHSTNSRKLEEKIDQLLNGKQQSQPKADVPLNEWDEKLQKDWKGTVSEISRLEVQEILKQERERTRAEAEQARTNQLLENNKRQVLTKHSELNDEGSQKADIYRQVIQEHPEYISNPFGPVLAMRDMEDRLREQGVYDEPVRQAVTKEVARQARTNGTTVAKGSVGSNGQKTIVLTKDQKEFCDANNIKYDSYAKSVSMLANKREIEG